MGWRRWEGGEGERGGGESRGLRRERPGLMGCRECNSIIMKSDSGESAGWRDGGVEGWRDGGMDAEGRRSRLPAHA